MSATLYPFSRCERGHDLSGDDAFIQQANGYRKCRICVSEDNRMKARKSVVHGAFEGGMGR